MPLDDFVLKYSPVERTPFRQAEWLADVGALKSRGRCYGFALAYMLALSKGATGKDLIETLKIAADKTNPDPNVINELITTSIMTGHDDWLGTDYYALQFDGGARNKVLRSFGLKVESTARFVHKRSKFTDLATYVATNTTTLNLLCTPNHALAAVSRPAGQQMWAFFDPNLGDATFRSRIDLHNCVANFFANKIIKGHYRRKEISPVGSDEFLKKQKEEVEKMTVSVVRCMPI